MEKTTKSNNDNGGKLKRNVYLNILYHSLLLIVPFITTPYVSRVLTAEGVGIYGYTNSLVTYFTMVAALGTIAYGTREVARSRDSKEEISKKFWEIEILTVITSSIVLLAWLVLAFCYKEYSIFLLLLSFNIVSTMFDISWLYAGLEKYKYSILINMLFRILSVVAIFLFVKQTSDLWIYILICVLSLLFGNMSMWIFLPKVLCKCKIELKNIKHHFKETLVYFIPTVAVTIYTVLDKSLIGLLIQGETVVQMPDGSAVISKTSELENGYYEQATKIINIVKVASFVGINGVMESRAGYLYAKDDEDTINKLLRICFSITLFLSFGGAFGLAAISKTFVPLFFGSGYDKTTIILYFLSLLVPIICVSNVLGCIYYTPSGRRKQSTVYLIIGSVINLTLNIPLIILFKSVGASIASVVAESVISFLYVKNCKIFTFKELLLKSWKKVVSGILMFTAVFLFGYFMNFLNPFLLLGLQILIGVIVYTLVLLLLKDDSINLGLKYFNKFLKRGNK